MQIKMPLMLIAFILQPMSWRVMTKCILVFYFNVTYCAFWDEFISLNPSVWFIM